MLLMRHTHIHSLLIILRTVLKGVVRIPLCVGMALVGYYLYRQYPMPWSLLAGLPLILVGTSAGLFSVYDFIVPIISSQWRRQHCPYCRSVRKVADILSPHNGFHGRRSAEDDIHRLHI